MTLDNLQKTVDHWIREHGGYWDAFQILARLTEELGEIAAALQRRESLRPHKSEVDLADEVGDLLFTLAAFANANGMKLDECMDKVMDKYNNRDSRAWKEKNQT